MKNTKVKIDACSIPFIPMVKILRSYAGVSVIPYDFVNVRVVIETFKQYCNTAAKLN